MNNSYMPLPQSVRDTLIKLAVVWQIPSELGNESQTGWWVSSRGCGRPDYTPPSKVGPFKTRKEARAARHLLLTRAMFGAVEVPRRLIGTVLV